MKKRIAVDMSQIKHAEIKSLSSSLGMSIKDFVDKAITDFIKKLKKKKDK